jgi:hypothetical protein
MVFRFSSYIILFIYIYDNYIIKKERSINNRYYRGNCRIRVFRLSLVIIHKNGCHHSMPPHKCRGAVTRLCLCVLLVDKFSAALVGAPPHLKVRRIYSK